MHMIFMKENIVVYTPTMDDYIEVVGYALKIGKLWKSGSRLILEKQWYNNIADTCVNIGGKKIGYGNINDYIFDNINILTMNDFRYKVRIEKTFNEFV